MTPPPATPPPATPPESRRARTSSAPSVASAVRRSPRTRDIAPASINNKEKMDQAALSTKSPSDSSPGGNSSSDEESCPIRRIIKKDVADAMKKKNTPGAKHLVG
jgi:hypothetical protein